MQRLIVRELVLKSKWLFSRMVLDSAKLIHSDPSNRQVHNFAAWA